jgi:hypothetical protein
VFAPTEPAAPPAQSSLVEDCIDIWFAPSSVFARREKAGAWGPYLVTTLLLVLLFYASSGAMQGVFDAEVARAIQEAQAQNPNLTADQLAQMQGMIEGSVRWGGFIVMPFLALGLGALTWLAAKVLGGTLSFGGGVMVASLAYLPKALELLLVLVQSFVLDPPAVKGRFGYSIGLGRFFDPTTTSQGLYNLAGRVDVFTVWVTVLLVLGLIHTAKVERGKAIAGGVGLWVLGGLPALFQLIGGK